MIDIAFSERMTLVSNWIYTLLDFIFVFFLCSTIFYSVRYHRQKEPIKRGIDTARMNVSMGIMIADIGVIQLISADLLHTIIGAIFLVLGSYNLFAGIRNYKHFKSLS